MILNKKKFLQKFSVSMAKKDLVKVGEVNIENNMFANMSRVIDYKFKKLNI